MSDSRYQRFLFEQLDIRGAIVHLGEAWRTMIAERGYPPAISQMLGEMTAITVLLGGQLKHEGRLTFQARGNGPVGLLVIDCESTDEALRLRGMARADWPADMPAAKVPEMFGDGRLLMSIDLPDSRVPFQSIVPLDGATIGEVFESYLRQSEQQASRLVIAAGPTAACGVFVQKMPDADRRDPDGWTRIGHLLDTLKPEELLELAPEALLQRLFYEETVRVFTPREVVHHCPEDWEKVRATLTALGRSEVEALLDEQGEIVIRDDICNREYRLDRAMALEFLEAAEHRLH
ncbi:MAG TPA: Hsp33 family molecular chaperone HslO [Rhodocyclaceae bacterium]